MAEIRLYKCTITSVAKEISGITGAVTVQQFLAQDLIAPGHVPCREQGERLLGWFGLCLQVPSPTL